MPLFSIKASSVDHFLSFYFYPIVSLYLEWAFADSIKLGLCFCIQPENLCLLIDVLRKFKFKVITDNVCAYVAFWCLSSKHLFIVVFPFLSLHAVCMSRGSIWVLSHFPCHSLICSIFIFLNVWNMTQDDEKKYSIESTVELTQIVAVIGKDVKWLLELYSTCSKR